ncbi:flagellar M-ring protein FliF C-terminal domain-containing protein, partial [Campylobacter fetus]
DQYATIKRVTAAVVVDGKYEREKKEDGSLSDTIVYVPLSDDEINKIKSLVEQTIGYNSTRGDEVTVSNFEFKKAGNLNANTTKIGIFYDSYLKPLAPVIKYLIVLLILFVFYKKVITPFLQKMVENAKEEDFEPQKEESNIEEEAEDTLEKFKAARKRVEDELGIGEDFNEDELKYEVLLEKMKLIVSERSEEISTLLQGMIKNDSDFNSRKEF